MQKGWALLALIVFGVVMIFVRIPGGSLVYSVLGLVIFAGLTLFDFQRLRRSSDLDSAPLRRAVLIRCPHRPAETETPPGVGSGGQKPIS